MGLNKTKLPPRAEKLQQSEIRVKISLRSNESEVFLLPEDEVAVGVDEVECVARRVGRLVEDTEGAAEAHVLLRGTQP